MVVPIEKERMHACHGQKDVSLVVVPIESREPVLSPHPAIRRVFLTQTISCWTLYPPIPGINRFGWFAGWMKLENRCSALNYAREFLILP